MNAADRDDDLRRLKGEFQALRLADGARGRLFAAAVHKVQGCRRAWGLRLAVGATVVGVVALVVARQGRTDMEIRTVEGHLTTPAGDAAPGARLSPGSVLETPVSAAKFRIGPHAIALAQHSRMLLARVQTGAVDLDLQKGRVNLTVSPLRAGEHLRVRAGELLVEVVGTVFEVARGPRCSSVSVSRGRVRTQFEGRSEFVSAGEVRTYCPAPVAAAPSVSAVAPSPSLPPASKIDEARPRPARPRVAWVQPNAFRANQTNPATAAARPLVAAQAEEPPAPSLPASESGGSDLVPSAGSAPTAHSVSSERPAVASIAPVSASSRPEDPLARPLPSTEPATDEETLFREITRSPLGSPASADLCRTYLQRYPDGLFSEEASWKLLRANYAAAENREVVRLAEPFLRRFSRSTRANDVRLLYVHSLVELGQSPSRPILDSLLTHWQELPASHQEEAVYLAVRSLCAPRPERACAEWLRVYQTQFPGGRYAEQVKKAAP